MKLFLALALVALVGCAVEGRVLKVRDIKSDLITKGNDLIKKAEELLPKLETATKTHEITVIKEQSARIHALIAQLEVALDPHRAHTLERELNSLETRLAHELALINPVAPVVPVVVPVPANPVVTRDLKSDLITKGEALLKQADAEIIKLEAAGHTHEAVIVKTEETAIKLLIADLQATTDEVKIRALEHELAHQESRLANELNRINNPRNRLHPTIPDRTLPELPVIDILVTRDLKSDLIAKGEALVKQADEAAIKLEAEKKTQEVTILKSEETRIKKLVADLQAATGDVAHLERELRALEARLAHELARVGHTVPVVVPVPVPANPVTRDVKSDLIAKGEALVKQATEAATKLEADKKTHEATVVKTEEARLQKLITDLQAATDEARIRSLERELVQAELRLQHELARVNRTPVVPPVVPVVPTNP